MKTLFSKWNSISLIKRIIAGLILGVILAVAVPKAQAISILGDLFVGALKAIAPVLIFFLVIGSLCRAKTGKGSMKIVILLYLLGNLPGLRRLGNRQLHFSPLDYSDGRSHR